MVAAMPRCMRLATFVLGFLFLAASAARADGLTWEAGPPGATPTLSPPKVTREISYSHQTLASDGIAAVLVIAAFRQDNPYSGLALLMCGADVYALGAPIVHLANREVGNSLKSLGLRVGLPWLGAMAGGMVGPKDTVKCDGVSGCPGSQESAMGVAIGAGLGALAAVVIDARYVARKRVTEAAPSFAPTASYSPAGWSVGVGGSF